MDNNTKSEQEFARFCTMNAIECKRIPEKDVPTNDYQIIICKNSIAVEVKEINPNDSEINDYATLQREKVVVGDVSKRPGERVRNLIEKSKRQFKQPAEHGLPTVLVLFDNVFHEFHTCDYSILVAMYGLQTLRYSLSNRIDEVPQLIAYEFGGCRGVTPDKNIEISAVAVLSANKFDQSVIYRDPGDKLYLTIYHNCYAKVPLDYSLFEKYPSVRQFIRPCLDSDEFTDWQPLEE